MERPLHSVPRIVVTAAVIEEDGRFLVTRRPGGVHLEGFWEFPGGKCEEGESHVASLEREITEELDTSVRIDRELFSVAHTYADRVVELHFFACRLTGTPRAGTRSGDEVGGAGGSAVPAFSSRGRRADSNAYRMTAARQCLFSVSIPLTLPRQVSPDQRMGCTILV